MEINNELINSNCFCSQYLTKFIGIKSATINELLNNDYDSIQALLAFDTSLDLERLPNVSMGQKSLLRKALIRLKQEFEQRINDLNDCNSNHNSNTNEFKLNSTPINDNNNSFGFVDNHYSFNELIETALTKNFINGHDLIRDRVGLGFTLSPVTKREEISGQIDPEVQHNVNESQENDTKLINRAVDLLTPTSNKKKKRKTKRFKYTMRRRRRMSSNNMSGSNNRENRTLVIDIDSQIDDKPLAYSSVQSMNESNNEGINSENEMDLSTHSLICDIKQEVIHNENSAEEQTEDNFDIWRDLKSEVKPKIKSLLTQNSKRIKFVKLNESSQLDEQYLRIAVDGFITHLVYCNKCHNPLKFDKKYLRRHLNICKPTVGLKFDGEIVTEEDLLSSTQSSDKVTSNAQKRGDKRKSSELLKSVSTPTIMLKRLKIDFNKSLNQYSVDIKEEKIEENDGMSTNNVIVNNFNSSMISEPKTPNSSSAKTSNSSSAQTPSSSSAKKTKDNTMRYKCNFIGCQFSSAYPFSLEQHKVKHKKSLVLEGMNSIVKNHLKQTSILSNSERNQSLVSSSSNQSFSGLNDNELKSKPKLIDCQTNGCKTNILLNKRIKNEIKSDEQNNSKNDSKLNQSIRYSCQSPDCKYGNIYKIKVKKHMLNIHDMEYKNTEHNISIASNSNSIDEKESESISEKIVQKLKKMVFREDK